MENTTGRFFRTHRTQGLYAFMATGRRVRWQGRPGKCLTISMPNRWLAGQLGMNGWMTFYTLKVQDGAGATADNAFWFKVQDGSERIHALAGSARRSSRGRAVGWIPSQVFRHLAWHNAPHGLQRCAWWKRSWNVIGLRQTQCNVFRQRDCHIRQRCEYPMG